MKLFILAMLLVVVAAFSLSYNGSFSYSPMDNYSNAVVKDAADSVRHAEETKAFLNR